MSYQTILYDLSDSVATITLNRPQRMNALSIELLKELAQAIGQAEAEGARALVLTGSGTVFCSGADLLDGMPDDLGVLLDAYYHPVVNALAEIDFPVVVAINGPAVGAGLSLALAGDIVLMARSAYLLIGFANIGLVPDAGAHWRGAKSAGRAKALKMALLAEKVSAEQALDYGLVSETVEDGELAETARVIAKRFAQGPSIALGFIRKQVAAALNSTLAETLDIEKANQAAAGRTRDFREAATAFAEKRKPEFRGE